MKQNKKLDQKKQWFAYTAAFLMGFSMFSPSQAYDEYQYKVLFSPTAEILEAETRGSVMIYDGLRYATVMRAMDEQFNRIENMMFVGTIVESDDGELEYEEDGCD